MKTVEYECDGGCGSKSADIEGWLVLSQAGLRASNSELKLVRDLHFRSLSCLQTWVDKAYRAAPILEKRAADLDGKHGVLSDPEVPGLYI
ncbi:MAG TPA: hypothetical protein VJG48_01760 [Candidatus Paceibacterota bacterium]